MMNYVYQTLKHIAEFTLERQRWKERERGRIIPLAHKFCLQTLPSILNRVRIGGNVCDSSYHYTGFMS